MASLLYDRLQIAPAFSKVGVDFFEPLKVIARISEPLPPAKRDETLPYALFLFIGKCMEMIV